MNTELLKTYTVDLLQAMGVSSSAVEVSDGPRYVVEIAVSDGQDLVGNNGDILQALNTIARRMVEVRHGAEAANFLIDVNGYHATRLQKLQDAVLLLAQRTRLFKHEVELDPMTSYERLVIHELFAEDTEIETESRGEGKTRHVVLKYKATQAADTAL